MRRNLPFPCRDATESSDQLLQLILRCITILLLLYIVIIVKIIFQCLFLCLFKNWLHKCGIKAAYNNSFTG